jgi:hypothetical protein
MVSDGESIGAMVVFEHVLTDSIPDGDVFNNIKPQAWIFLGGSQEIHQVPDILNRVFCAIGRGDDETGTQQDFQLTLRKSLASSGSRLRSASRLHQQSMGLSRVPPHTNGGHKANITRHLAIYV